MEKIDLSKSNSKSEFFKKNKNLLIAIGAALGGIAIIAIIVIIVLSFSSNQKSLTKELEEMGRDFYENYYYDSLHNNYKDNEDGFKAFLSGYKDTGFKVDLDNLSRVNNNKEKLKDFVNSKTKEECDKSKSMITIYPQESYGKTNYKIDVKLVCGFDKEN